MITNAGLERERNLIMADMLKLKAGTGTTAPTGLDAALEAEVVEVDAGVETIAAGKHKISGRLNSASANGNTLQEIGTTCAGGLYDRLIVLPVAKSSDIEVEYEITIERRNKV